MNPARRSVSLLRALAAPAGSASRSRASVPVTARRYLTTPTTPAQASVSNANVGTTKAPSTEELIREDVEEGVLADQGEDGTGMSIPLNKDPVDA